MALLEVKNLTVYYGTVRALDNTSFHVDEGEVVTIIGPNGAGKSTALKVLCGLIQLNGKSHGQIIFNGKKIKNQQPYQLVKKGICLVPEGRRIFGTMTVLENLQMGAFTVSDEKVIKDALERVFNLFPKLKERCDQRARTLSSGEQQMLAIGRALMLKPRLLLLDEPSLGLSPNYVQDVFDNLTKINKDGTAILLVEQNTRMALQYSDRGYVFEMGKIAKEGTSNDLVSDEGIKKSFLGG